MLCNKCTQASLVGTTHGVDHFAAPEEQESRHRCHTKLLRKLAEHIHINFDADGGVGILVSKRGKRRCDALARTTPSRREVHYEQLVAHLRLCLNGLKEG